MPHFSSAPEAIIRVAGAAASLLVLSGANGVSAETPAGTRKRESCRDPLGTVARRWLGETLTAGLPALA